MRVLLLNHRYFPFRGGSELVTQRLAEHLAQCGNDVHVVTTTAHDLEAIWDPARSRVESPSEERIDDVQVHRVELAYRPLNKWLFPAGHRLQGELARFGAPAGVQRRISQSLLGFSMLRQRAASLGPFDLVIVTNLGLDALAIEGANLAEGWGVPFVLIPFLHIGVDSDSIARRYSSMSHQVDLMNRASLIVCMTDIEANFIRTLGINSPITATGAGFDVDDVIGGNRELMRKKLGIDRTLIGGLGAMAEGKGTFDTIRAVQALRRSGADVELVLIGPGDRAIRRYLNRSPSSDRTGIHVLGMVDDQTRKDVLAALDIACLPSRTESFGIVYLEAWANDCPVIGARAGGVPALIRHEHNGLLVDFGAPDQIAGAIRRLVEEPEFSMRLACKGRELALSTYTWPRVLNKMSSAIEEATGLKIKEAADGC